MQLNISKKIRLFIVFLLVFCSFQGVIQATPEKLIFNRYHTPAEVVQIIKNMGAANSGTARWRQLASSFGQQEIVLLEIGPEVAKEKKNSPAVLVVANMEGNVPIATEAALFLAQTLLEKPALFQDKTWYILPMGNPDAAARYFKKPLCLDSRNNRPVNDDMDDATDEDGVDDLDGNGFITIMRVKSPDGQWLPVPGEPRLLKKADWSKGEKGIYTLYSEGIDNDGDGKYNEDGPGGVNIGVNFPHLFKFHTPDGGLWAGSEEETFRLFQFVFSHPEIAMTISFGATNFCWQPPQGGRREMADFSKIKLPEFIAKQFGWNPDQTYTMPELIEKAQRMMPPGVEITENLIAGFLGLGAAVNPQPDDLKFYSSLSEQYKEFLKKNKMDGKRLEPARDKDGSFELWAYYHLGVPSFSMDFWTVPALPEEKKEQELTPEKLENMTTEEFIALGEEKIGVFLKSSGAPADINAKMVLNMVKNGMMTTKKMAEMLRQMPKPKSEGGADATEKALLAYSDTQLKGKGFVEWKSFKHPTLGEVEIGGFVPFTGNTPQASQLTGLLEGQVPWVFELAKNLPHIKIAKTEVKSLGSGLFRVKVWVENSGFLPYPTSMGIRNQRIQPVVVTLKDGHFKLIEGKKRALIKSIGGYDAESVEWIIQSEQPDTLHIEVYTPQAWSDSTSVNLSSGGRE